MLFTWKSELLREQLTPQMTAMTIAEPTQSYDPEASFGTPTWVQGQDFGSPFTIFLDLMQAAE